jgi:hypothetical protein
MVIELRYKKSDVNFVFLVTFSIHVCQNIHKIRLFLIILGRINPASQEILRFCLSRNLDNFKSQSEGLELDRIDHGKIDR